MVAINSLGLEGLRSLFNIKTAPSQKDTAGSGLQDILSARTDSVIVSGLAQDIGATYQRLKDTGNAEAVAGFSAIVQGFGTDYSHQDIVDVTRGTAEMSDADLQTYGELAGAIHDLGNDSTLARWASQSAQIYIADADLGRSYLGATAAIVNGDYAGSRGEVVEQKLTSLHDYMGKFAALPPGEGSSAMAIYQEFAEEIRASADTGEIAQTINDFSPDQDDSAG